LGGTGFKSRCRRDFPHPSRPVVSPNQPSIQCVSGLFRRKSARGGGGGGGFDPILHPYLDPTLKKEQNYTSTTPEITWTVLR
jgi:hypothetical protein